MIDIMALVSLVTSLYIAIDRQNRALRMQAARG
jgi:hypothetical protein